MEDENKASDSKPMQTNACGTLAKELSSSRKAGENMSLFLMPYVACDLPSGLQIPCYWQYVSQKTGVGRNTLAKYTAL